jgi:Kef-type K+ transport system membrane component KefB
MPTSGIRSAVVGSLIWLLVCSVAGYVVVARLGEYGSIARLLVGVGLGLAGAISHAALSASAAFRSSGIIRRALLTWLVGYSAFVAIAIFLLNPAAKMNSPRFWPEAFKFYVVNTGGPMLLLSLVVAWSTRQPRSGRAGQHVVSRS